MKMLQYAAAGTAAVALVGAAQTAAVPFAEPAYTFCEDDGYNSLCDYYQEINAWDAVSYTGNQLARDCFYINGKLQKNCVWDITPKCALVAFNKPVQSFSAAGQPLPGHFYEPILANTATSGGNALYGLTPIDGQIRLGVTAVMDAFDGTVNGLASNSPHGEVGEVTIKVYYNGGKTARGYVVDEPDDSYVFRFQSGADALRVAFPVPQGVESVDVVCCNDTGTVEICYDVDFYKIRGLRPGQPYCLTVVGGLNYDCEKTDTLLGWFDKNCNLIFSNGLDDDGGLGVYSNLCIFADGDGDIRFAISGSGDENFNGLNDATEKDYFDFLDLLNTFQIEGYPFSYMPGVSTKNDTYEYVNRYPRTVWDGLFRNPGLGINTPTPFGPLTTGEAPETFFQHGVCGEYVIKVRYGTHVEPEGNGGNGGGNGDVLTGPARADLNGDGIVNAQDLAILLSFWGMSAQ